MIIIHDKKRVIRSAVITLILLSLPVIAHATTIDTSLEGYTKLLSAMKVYVRGSGAIVLLVGCGDFFISLSNDSNERLVKAMQVIGAGFFLIIADSFIQAIATADGSQTFSTLLSFVGLIISFIGAVLSMMGGYKAMNSIKDRNAEARSKGIRTLVSGLMLIALSQSLTNFLM